MFRRVCKQNIFGAAHTGLDQQSKASESKLPFCWFLNISACLLYSMYIRTCVLNQPKTKRHPLKRHCTGQTWPAPNIKEVIMTNDPMSSKLPSKMHSEDLDAWHKTQATAEDMVCPPGQRVMCKHRNTSVVISLWNALQYKWLIDCDSIIFI